MTALSEDAPAEALQKWSGARLGTGGSPDAISLAPLVDAETERRRITILMLDISRSTELIWENDPEEAQLIIDEVLDDFKRSVHRYQGFVARVLGDAILAFFGAPLAAEDHCLRACYASLAARDAVGKRIAENPVPSAGVQLDMHAGICSGEVVLRKITNDVGEEYDAIGAPVHMAARLQGLAKAGEIMIASATYQEVKSFIRCESRGLQKIRGVEDPVEVFEVLDGTDYTPRLHESRNSYLTGFSGRSFELADLNAALTKAKDGQGQICAVVGDAGVGKSRLSKEFMEHADIGDSLVIESFCTPYGRSVPYLPIVKLLNRVLSVSEDLPEDERTQRVCDWVDGQAPELQSAKVALLKLMGFRYDDPKWDVLEERQRQQLMHDAFRRVIAAAAGSRLTIMFLEDLHWIDSQSYGLLSHFFDTMETSKVLALINFRSHNFHHQWGSRENYRQIHLTELYGENLQAFLDTLLGSTQDLRDLRDELVHRAGGNPFFLEQCVRHAAEQGILKEADGHFEVIGQVKDLDLPDSVESVISSRFDKLSHQDKSILRAASTIGFHFSLELLAQVTLIALNDLRRRLQDLGKVDFIRETRLYPKVEFTFEHVLTQEVIYQQVLVRNRVQLHARIVEVMESYGEAQLEDNIEELAYHAEQAKLHEKAAVFFNRSGIKAARRSALKQATDFFHRALEHNSRIEGGEGLSEQAIDIRCNLRNCLELRQPERLVSELKEAERVAQRIGDNARLAKVKSYLTHALWVAGQPKEAIQQARSAITLAREVNDQATEISSCYHLGLACIDLGQHPEANDYLERTIDLCGGNSALVRFELNLPPALLARSYLSRSLGETGAFEHAERRGKECLALAEELKEPYALGFAYFGLGHLKLVEMDIEAAQNYLAQSHYNFVESGTEVMPPVVAAYLGHAQNLIGNVPKALDMLREAIATTEKMQIMSQQPVRLLFLSEAQRRSQQLDEAEVSASKAREMAMAQDEESSLAYALFFLGLIARDRGDDDAAKAFFTEASQIAGRLDMAPLRRHCHSRLTKLSNPDASTVH